MRILWAFIRTAFSKASIYRLDFWSSLIANFIMMYGIYSLWNILYQQIPNAFDKTLPQMTTYGVLGMLIMPFMSVAFDVQRYINERVREGTIEIDLMKPLSFIQHMLYRNLGDFMLNLLTKALPGFLFAILFLNFQLPPSWFDGLLFVISIGLGYLVLFEINLLIGFLAFITADIRSYTWAFNALGRFASGQVVPLWMFPPTLATFVAFLPFKDAFFAPMSIYIGAQDGNIARTLFSQFAWLLGLYIAMHLVWLKLQRRIIVQGG